MNLIPAGGSASASPQKLVSWDVSDSHPGYVTLRLIMTSNNNGYAEKLLRLNLQLPTPTASSTSTVTSTPACAN